MRKYLNNKIFFCDSLQTLWRKNIFFAQIFLLTPFFILFPQGYQISKHFVHPSSAKRHLKHRPRGPMLWKIRYLITIIYTQKKAAWMCPKWYSLYFVKPFKNYTLLILPASWKFPTAWSEKPKYQKIVLGKYFKTTLHIKIFQQQKICVM